MERHTETILIVEDDKQIQNFINYSLTNEGYRCLTAVKGKEALQALTSNSAGLILLDLGLPDMDGLDIIKTVREWSYIPIIVISARDQDEEKAYALDIGADDYLTKPFSATELMARIRVALRHSHREKYQHEQSSVSVGDLLLDYEKHLVYLEGSEIHLTPLEYKLLSLFFHNIGKVLTTSYIIKEVWGNGYGDDTQALRALMAGLRRKIEKNPTKPKYIKTEIGVGYRLLSE